MNQRNIWTEARVNELRKERDAIVATGTTKAFAYKTLAPKWGIAPDYMAKLCTSGINKIRANARKYTQQRRNADSQTTAVNRNTSANVTTGATMSAQEAMEFYMFLKRMNITIA